MARKIKSESQTEREIILKARELGVEDQAKKIIMRHKDAIKNVKTDYERHHIAACGMVELHRLFGCVGPLVVDGVEILPAQPGYDDLISFHTPGIIVKP